jgi:alkanesulfonate monooxygenase SsuD/methylene tetrahydromethanopterin reductase-like flavin-dependent oxidoreductase (luciferase family)
MIRLVEVRESSRGQVAQTEGRGQRFTLSEIYINPTHVVCIREDASAIRFLNEGLLPEGLDDRQRFTRLHLNRGQGGLELIVVGSPDTIGEKLNLKTPSNLLKG